MELEDRYPDEAAEAAWASQEQAPPTREPDDGEYLPGGAADPGPPATSRTNDEIREDLRRAASTATGFCHDASMRLAGDFESLLSRLVAVEAWAMENEIAAPPLDWAGLGAILHPSASPTPTGGPTTDAVARILAKHQLAEVLPFGVACTCGAELAALNPPLDDAAIKGEPLALAVHQMQQIETGDRP